MAKSLLIGHGINARIGIKDLAAIYNWNCGILLAWYSKLSGTTQKEEKTAQKIVYYVSYDAAATCHI